MSLTCPRAWTRPPRRILPPNLPQLTVISSVKDILGTEEKLPTATRTRACRVKLVPLHQPYTMLVRVLHAYSATTETELSVQPDERLTLIEGDSEGWVQVATLDGQREGFVPTSYVTLDEAVDDDDGGSSVSSHGSFTTVAPSRAAQPNIIAAKALGAQLAGRLAAATSRDAQGMAACASGLYEPFGDLKIDETQPSAAEEELVAPWDSVSCLGEESQNTPRARGLRLLPHDDGRPTPTKGGVRVMRPPTLQALLVAAHAKQAVLWPGAPLCVGLALYDEDGCEVVPGWQKWQQPSACGLHVWSRCARRAPALAGACSSGAAVRCW